MLGNGRDLLVAAATGAIIAVTLWEILRKQFFKLTATSLSGATHDPSRTGLESLIGSTPLIRLRALSAQTGCDIYAKCEFMNPGGSSKDRVALAVVQDAEARGVVKPWSGCTLVEGTSGSTGIALAVVARARGYKCHIVVPDDVSRDKIALLETLGAHVEIVRPSSIVDPGHYVNVARRRAQEINDSFQKRSHEQASPDGTSQPIGSALFCDQFENLSNWKVHYDTTGPEIHEQMRLIGELSIDAFVMGAGTGGTISGVARFLKQHHPHMLAVAADPQGSGLYNRVLHGIMYSPKEAEGSRRRHQVDSIVEGIGINRATANLAIGLDEQIFDSAERVADQQAVHMARFLLKNEGFFVGSSSAVNCVAAVRIARQLGPGHRIVTVLCDHGSRHLTKFWNDEAMKKLGLDVTAHSSVEEFL